MTSLSNMEQYLIVVFWIIIPFAWSLIFAGNEKVSGKPFMWYMVTISVIYAIYGCVFWW